MESTSSEKELISSKAEDKYFSEETEKKNDSESDEENFELPSKITDRFQILMPKQNSEKSGYDPKIYGKWLWFSNGDLELQDQIWIRLQPLLEHDYILQLGSSTARKSRQGVVKCFTSKERLDIMRAGRAMQSVIRGNSILFYKTVQAAQAGLSRRLKDRFISNYMLTVGGRFYEKDYLDRWIKIADDGMTCEGIRPIRSYLSESKMKKLFESEMLPSQETKKEKYFSFRREGRSLRSGIWCLFCDVDNMDCNSMTELDHVWIGANHMYGEGFFIGIMVETNAYFDSYGCSNYLRRSIKCFVPDYQDIDNVYNTGRKLLEKTNYQFPIYLKYIKEERNNHIYCLKYLLTDDNEFYEYIHEKWVLIENIEGYSYTATQTYRDSKQRWAQSSPLKTTHSINQSQESNVIPRTKILPLYPAWYNKNLSVVEHD